MEAMGSGDKRTHVNSYYDEQSAAHYRAYERELKKEKKDEIKKDENMESGNADVGEGS